MNQPIPPQDPLSYWVTQTQQTFRDMTRDLETLRSAQRENRDNLAETKLDNKENVTEIKTTLNDFRKQIESLKFQQSVVIGLLLLLIGGVVFNTYLAFAR